jgi:hypothetical protein
MMLQTPLHREDSLLKLACVGTVLLALWGCSKREDRSTKEAAPASAPPLPSVAQPLAQKDCPSAQRYRDNICELAKRICGLQADPGGNASAGSAGTGDYCKDAQTRCDEAKQRWQADCE